MISSTAGWSIYVGIYLHASAAEKARSARQGSQRAQLPPAEFVPQARVGANSKPRLIFWGHNDPDFFHLLTSLCGGVQALAAIPAERAEWLLMMDQTTIVDDISFNIPLRRYAGKHLVLLGDKTLLAADEYHSRASLKLQEPLQGTSLPQALHSLYPLVLNISSIVHYLL